MNRRETGMLLMAIGLIMIPIDISFMLEFMAWGAELHKTCPLDPSVCPFITPPWQGIFMLGASAFIALMGFLVYRKPFTEAKGKPDIERARKALGKLDGDEKAVYGMLLDENGMIFQSKLIEKTGFSKVKMSRVLDRLENKGMVERKRRGMTNVVVLK